MKKSMWRTFSKASRSLTMLVGIMLILLGVDGVKAAPPAIPITQADIPYTIYQPGRYVVAEDLAGLPDVAVITITASNVHLDLNHHLLSGPVTTSDDCIFTEGSIGVKITGATNARFSNGTIQGFSVGVLLLDSLSSQVSDLTIKQTCWEGIQLDNTHYSSITNSDISYNFHSGVRLTHSHNNRFNANIVTDNPLFFGYLLLESHNNAITSNTISRNYFGVQITCGATTEGNEVRNNVVNNNQSGITVGCGNGLASKIVVSGNTVTNNSNGIVLSTGTSESTVRNNTVRGNVRGIFLYDNGQNRVLDNTSLNNADYDMYDGNLPACVNFWTRNTFSSDNEGDGPEAGCIQ